MIARARSFISVQLEVFLQRLFQGTYSFSQSPRYPLLLADARGPPGTARWDRICLTFETSSKQAPNYSRTRISRLVVHISRQMTNP
jgi:hypothetical protein